jgi:hypothetical protein
VRGYHLNNSNRTSQFLRRCLNCFLTTFPGEGVGFVDQQLHLSGRRSRKSVRRLLDTGRAGCQNSRPLAVQPVHQHQHEHSDEPDTEQRNFPDVHLEFAAAVQPHRPHQRHRRPRQRDPARREIHLHSRDGLLPVDDLLPEDEVLADDRRRPEDGGHRAPRQSEDVDQLVEPLASLRGQLLEIDRFH